MRKNYSNLQDNAIGVSVGSMLAILVLLIVIFIGFITTIPLWP